MTKVGDFIAGLATKSTSNLLDSVANNINQFVETKDEKRAALLEIAKAQIELNKEEAKHKNIFVSGWRPFIGWVCGAALAYNFILREVLIWILANSQTTFTTLPALQMDHLITILLALLGMGGLRTWEKKQGIAK